jgi:hypothetical protein
MAFKTVLTCNCMAGLSFLFNSQTKRSCRDQRCLFSFPVLPPRCFELKRATGRAVEPLARARLRSNNSTPISNTSPVSCAFYPRIAVNSRFFYRNGRIHTESRERAGNLHGAYRVWHRNGPLAEELRYRHGLMHGVSRDWDETGRLLGSFTMVKGSGLQRYWHE